MHVLQCQHHLRRLPRQDAVSLGCSPELGTRHRNSCHDHAVSPCIFARGPDIPIGEPMTGTRQNHFAVASTQRSSHVTNSNRCAEHDWPCPRACFPVHASQPALVSRL